MRDIVVKASSFQSGKYETKLFVEFKDSSYYWYDVSYKVAPRECSGAVQGKSIAGEVSEIAVKISNPLKDKQVIFAVSLQDLPLHFLQFQKTITVGKQETVFFKLYFKPMAMGSWAGKIKFYTPDLGEYWYNVSFSCDELKSEMFQLEAAIGNGVEQVIPVMNFLDEIPLTYTVDLSNNDSFQIIPKRTFQVKPKE